MVDKIEVDEHGVVRLVLFDGPTPVGMSTHELKAYAHNQFFGATLEKLERAKKASYGDAYSIIREAIEPIQFN